MPAGGSLSIHPAQMRDHNAAELPVPDRHAVLVDHFNENVALRDVEVAWIDGQEIANSPNSEQP